MQFSNGLPASKSGRAFYVKSVLSRVILEYTTELYVYNLPKMWLGSGLLKVCVGKMSGFKKVSNYISQSTQIKYHDDKWSYFLNVML